MSIVAVIALLILSGLVYANYMNRRLSVDPATYSPLLNLIARVESSDNYNAYFGNAKNTKIKFTDMTINDVIKWQQEFVDGDSPSSAVGRYQIINTTLSGLIQEQTISSTEKFNQITQDKMAIALLERRGSVAYVNDEISRETFAANLAKEWAALPRITGENPNESFYAGDGLNAARTTPEEVLNAIDHIEAQ